MKKTMSLLIIAAIILTVAGCKRDSGDAVATPAPTYNIPTTFPSEATLPGEMKIADLLSFVSAIIDFDEGWELDVEYAEIWDDPEFNEIIYVFDYGSFEIVLFADIEADAFKYGYVRTMIIEYHTLVEAGTVAGAFLAALEPNEFERMFLEVMDFEVFETDPEHNYADEYFPEEVYESFGEVWGFALHENRRFNIFPIDESFLG